MSAGIGFLDILVSEITMVLGALVFLLCGGLLIAKRKTWGGAQKGLAAVVLIVTGMYLAFIVFLVIMWGR